MIKILGFLVGSAASIGLILIVLGMPDINLSEAVIDIDDEQLESAKQTVGAAKEDLRAVADEVVEEVAQLVTELPEAQPPAEPATITPTDETPSMDETRTTDQTPPVTEAVAGTTEDPTLPSEPPTPDDVPVTSLPPEPGPANEDATGNELKWHAFWNPFRSEIAANGFVGQLEKVTGLDYRVVKIKTGVYEVTFAYENDAERRDKLSRIASATGLDLPES